MGEAKKKKERIQKWADTLSPEELYVSQTALNTYNRFVEPSEGTGMCYRLSFFMSLYLQDKYGLNTKVQVGYINDGTDQIFISHAWLEFNGKITDISLTMTEHEDAQPTGDLLVQGYLFKKGRANYTYHSTLTDAQRDGLEEMARQDEYFKSALDRKKREHEFMAGMQNDREAQRRYLNGAPDGINYARLAEIIEQ